MQPCRKLTKHPDVYEGHIEAALDNGELKFSTVTRDEGERTLTFDFSVRVFSNTVTPVTDLMMPLSCSRRRETM